MEFPAKLLDHFSRNNKSNINQPKIEPRQGEKKETNKVMLVHNLFKILDQTFCVQSKLHNSNNSRTDFVEIPYRGLDLCDFRRKKLILPPALALSQKLRGKVPRFKTFSKYEKRLSKKIRSSLSVLYRRMRDCREFERKVPV